MSHAARPPDWTAGEPRLVVTECRRCGNPWYLPRNHCPVCGSGETRSVEAAGTGLCVAVTRLHVPADGSTSTMLCLVELDEGPTVLGRVHDDGLVPGQQARVTFLGTPIAPSFAREDTP